MSLSRKDKEDFALAMKGQPYIDAAYYDSFAEYCKIVVSARILMLRVKKGISQKQLAVMLSVSPQAVTMMEKGKRIPSFEVLCKLAEYFDVSLDYLVGRSDDPKRH